MLQVVSETFDEFRASDGKTGKVTLEQDNLRQSEIKSIWKNSVQVVWVTRHNLAFSP
jgi:hypothetical protein